ncbi:MAG: aspartate kinase, partial [Bacteroidales bacterium]|nr:aspartate kinase [Bacteroidales bacterium]
VLSTRLIYIYLKSLNHKVAWADARKLVLTDNLHREASVDWPKSSQKIQTHCHNDLNNNQWIITQGFIGADADANPTTLGREGSDFTGAIFAWALDAENLTIWKDVPGLLNADPKIFDNTTKLDTVSYGETIELAYYGATIIHPKTIKPLQNKQIPLFVKSFLHPQSEGSCIAADTFNDQAVPNFIVKKNQLLMSISPRDYSFMNEDHLAKIFSLLAKLHIKVNMMQISALSFSICIDDNDRKNNRLIEKLRTDYKIKYNKELELLTIRHYRQKDVSECSRGRKVLLEQRSRSTIQMVLTLPDK